MRRLLLGLGFAVLSACGGATPDYALNFIGTWIGTSVFANAHPPTVLATFQAEALISSTTPNVVAVSGACNLPDNSHLASSVNAMVTSATEFNTTDSYVCPKTQNSSCASIVDTVTALGGTLDSNGTLTLNLALTEDYCGAFGYFTVAFTATKS